MTDAGHDFLSHGAIALVTARCAGCGCRIATYWADPGFCDEHPAPAGEWRTWNASCTCMPAPRLPEGAKLEKLVERARRRIDDRVSRRLGHYEHAHAPVTVRVQ
jgi:hypothetical protein